MHRSINALSGMDKIFQGIDRSKIKAFLVGGKKDYDPADLRMLFRPTDKRYSKKRRYWIENFLLTEGILDVNTDLMEVFGMNDSDIFQLISFDRQSGCINTQTGVDDNHPNHLSNGLITSSVISEKIRAISFLNGLPPIGGPMVSV
jgi:hypothetical protein